MFKKTTLAAILAISMFAVSCSDDSSNNPTVNGGTTKTNQELITGNTYQVTSLKIDPPYDFLGLGTPISDLYAVGDDCSKDDRTTFNSDGTTTTDEGPTKCDPNDPQTTTGSWSLNEDQSIITVDQEEWNIVSVTTTGIEVNQSFVENDTTYTMTGKFTKL